MWQLRTMPAAPNAVAAVVAAVVFAASYAVGEANGEPPRDAGGQLTAHTVRACLDERSGDDDGLLFRTTRKASGSFVGVLMVDLTTRPTRMATIGIAIHDDADLLDAYEERAREDRDDEVARIQNTVVAFHGPFTGKLALGKRWVRHCLR